MSEQPPDFQERGPKGDPHPLDYVAGSKRARGAVGPEDKREFRVGLFGGCICSLVIWPLAFSGVLGGAAPFIGCVFVFAKIAFVTGLFWIPGGTRMGLGVLLSMGVGGLILTGTCFAAMMH